MRVDVSVPDALHICPGCGDVASGEPYCESCCAVAAFYDHLEGMTERRETAPAPAAPSFALEEPSGLLLGLLNALAFEGLAVGMGFAVHWMWHHWR